MSAMASLAGETVSADAAAESVAPSRLRDSNGHNGMHPMHTHTHICNAPAAFNGPQNYITVYSLA